MRLALDPSGIKGFLDPAEGERLYELARAAAPLGPCLEIGSYCGKSTIYLGSGVREAGGVLFTLDHHRGSEEHQPGQTYHDPELMDAAQSRFDSLPHLRRTLALAGLEDCVVPMVGSSVQVGRHWRTPLALVFVDGGHSLETAMSDYRTWAPLVVAGGYLAIHDIFPDPADGGQAPFEIYQRALASELFEQCESTRTLGVLRRRVVR